MFLTTVAAMLVSHKASPPLPKAGPDVTLVSAYNSVASHSHLLASYMERLDKQRLYKHMR